MYPFHFLKGNLLGPICPIKPTTSDPGPFLPLFYVSWATRAYYFLRPNSYKIAGPSILFLLFWPREGILIPKPTTEESTPPKVAVTPNVEAVSSAEQSNRGQSYKKNNSGPKNDLSDLSFLQKFSFSPTLSLKESKEKLDKMPIHQSNTQAGVFDFLEPEERFTPSNQLFQMMFGKQEDAKLLNSNANIIGTFFFLLQELITVTRSFFPSLNPWRL